MLVRKSVLIMVISMAAILPEFVMSRLMTMIWPFKHLMMEVWSPNSGLNFYWMNISLILAIVMRVEIIMMFIKSLEVILLLFVLLRLSFERVHEVILLGLAIKLILFYVIPSPWVFQINVTLCLCCLHWTWRKGYFRHVLSQITE